MNEKMPSKRRAAADGHPGDAVAPEVAVTVPGADGASPPDARLLAIARMLQDVLSPAAVAVPEAVPEPELEPVPARVLSEEEKFKLRRQVAMHSGGLTSLPGTAAGLGGSLVDAIEPKPEKVPEVIERLTQAIKVGVDLLCLYWDQERQLKDALQERVLELEGQLAGAADGQDEESGARVA